MEHIVKLQSDWYDPEGRFWAKRDNPHKVPADLFDAIASTAEVDGTVKSKWKGDKPPVLKGADKVEVEDDKAEVEAREEAATKARDVKLAEGEKRNAAVAGKI